MFFSCFKKKKDLVLWEQGLLSWRKNDWFAGSFIPTGLNYVSECPVHIRGHHASKSLPLLFPVPGMPFPLPVCTGQTPGPLKPAQSSDPQGNLPWMLPTSPSEWICSPSSGLVRTHFYGPMDHALKSVIMFCHQCPRWPLSKDRNRVKLFFNAFNSDLAWTTLSNTQQIHS